MRRSRSLSSTDSPYFLSEDGKYLLTVVDGRRDTMNRVLFEVVHCRRTLRAKPSALRRASLIERTFGHEALVHGTRVRHLDGRHRGSVHSQQVIEVVVWDLWNECPRYVRDSLLKSLSPIEQLAEIDLDGEANG